MPRIILMFCGTLALLVGAGFMLWGVTGWLVPQFGVLGAGLLVGFFLLVVGAIIFLFAMARPARSNRGIGSLGLLGRAGGPLSEIEGLAALGERHPLIASLVAVALGVATGREKARR